MRSWPGSGTPLAAPEDARADSTPGGLRVQSPALCELREPGIAASSGQHGRAAQGSPHQRLPRRLGRPRGSVLQPGAGLGGGSSRRACVWGGQHLGDGHRGRVGRGEVGAEEQHGEGLMHLVERGEEHAETRWRAGERRRQGRGFRLLLRAVVSAQPSREHDALGVQRRRWGRLRELWQQRRSGGLIAAALEVRAHPAGEVAERHRVPVAPRHLQDRGQAAPAPGGPVHLGPEGALQQGVADHDEHERCHRRLASLVPVLRDFGGAVVAEEVAHSRQDLCGRPILQLHQRLPEETPLHPFQWRRSRPFVRCRVHKLAVAWYT
mmetsp:Transcript_31032/g.83204  ORF Transcript_31032/g.83204 Transcript_31032/m.83204 type:complete len:322 (+) Transcript_31032:3-968(+)